MPDRPDENYQHTRRRLLLKHAALSCFVIAIAWILWAVNAFRGVDLLHLLSKDDGHDFSPTESLVAAAVVTAVMIGVAMFRASRALMLARRGVEVEGTITKHGIAYRGLVRVECAYTYADRDHVYIWSAHRETAPVPREKVPLLIDPENPEHCLLLEDVFPDRAPDRPKPGKTLLQQFGGYAIYTVGIIGLAWLAWVAYQRLAAPRVPKHAPAVVAAPEPNSPPQAVPPEIGPPPPPAVKPPGKEVLFQAAFTLENAKPTTQAAGFFAKAPGGKIAAITSIHSIDVAGPRLLKAQWVDPVSGKLQAEMDRSWGPPGELHVTQVTAGKDPQGKPIIIDILPKDRRTDYLLMPVPNNVPVGSVLELDPRAAIESNERVYFHDISAFGQKDYAVLEGTVAAVADEQYQIELDRDIEPQSQIGSPVISQTTGKVIGILSNIGDSGGDAIGSIFNRNPSHRRLILTPSTAILKAMNDSHDYPLLRDVIGKKAAN